ncbi:MAG TPA: YetF domain-containing protein [Jatrophihabitantaceae bacterium]|jgi:uncharacterized membrane protein YcaP (DUF421 family)
MEIVFRALFVFAFLWFITRVTGRSTLGELSTFQLLLYVTMGDLVQQAVTQQDYSVTSAVLAVGVFSLLTVLISWVNTRFSFGRPLTHGIPVVIVDHGEPLIATMRSERVSIDDLMSAAREQGLQRFSDIRVAVLETNGRISFFADTEESGAPDAPSVG